MKKCTEGKRHTWKFIRNCTLRTQTYHAASFTSKGVYKCSVCGERKYGTYRMESSDA